jgi:hypothetical protein
LAFGCHFFSQLKRNCLKLWEEIALFTALNMPISTFEYYERGHGNEVYRRVEVFVNGANLPNGWAGIERLIRVRRWGYRAGKRFDERTFYITSKPVNSASVAATIIQGHWCIENKLHRVKDVFMGEDDMSIERDSTATIVAHLNSVAINVLNMNGLKPTKDTFAQFANKVKELYILFDK